MRVAIDLDNRDPNSLRNIYTSWTVGIPPKVFPRGLGWLRELLHVDKKVLVGIEDVEIDEMLNCNGDKLFRIQHEATTYTQLDFPIDINLKQTTTPFQVFIDTESILDCREQQERDARIYHIRAKVYVRNASGRNIQEDVIDVEVEFKAPKINPSVKLALSDTTFIHGDELQYNSEAGEVEIGKVCFSYMNRWNYAPAINIKTSLQLEVDHKPCNNALAVYDKDGNMVTNVITLNDLWKFTACYVLKLDFAKLRNPLTAISVRITCNTNYCLTCEPYVFYPLIYAGDRVYDGERKFTIMPDPHSTELQVKHGFNDSTAPVTDDDNSTSYLSRFDFFAGGTVGARINLHLHNTATDGRSFPGAGVIVKRFSVSSEINGAEIINKRGRSLTANDIILVSGNDYEAMCSPNGFLIKNGKNSRADLNIDFMPAEIDELRNCSSYEFKILTTISFDYWENKTGRPVAEFEANMRTYKHTFVWNLYQMPNSEWLCVDFGTSAIVCLYNGKRVKLRERKEEIIKSDPTYGRLALDDNENGTDYLSSDIILHDQTHSSRPNISSLCSEQTALGDYSELAICLSPTNQMIVADALHRLPCLKLLIGHEFVPYSKQYRDLEIDYKRRDNNASISHVNAEEALRNEEQSAILKVDNVFLETYNTLFRYFIVPSVKDIHKVNKLLLTYPNTYTPLQLNILRDVAKKVFPTIREGYPRFVAESDAVAAYYMHRWDDYHTGEDMHRSETVLVYDMGAGTIDITVFKKTYDNGAKIYNVEILGKIGSTKGGNYLDTLIARILGRRGKVMKSLSRLNRGASPEIGENKAKLKHDIKNIIKPQLGKAGNTRIEGRNQWQYIDPEITVSDITGSSEFENYIKDVTEKIVGNIMSYLGGELRIDTVIMSGRASKLKAIKDKFQEVFAPDGRYGNPNIIFLDAPLNGEHGERQKLAVAQGAIAYCNPNSNVKITGKRMYANYGVVYSISGEIKYVQLLDHTEISADNTGNITTPTKTIDDILGAESITLIQSYMSEADTEQALRASNGNDNDAYEYISEMLTVDAAQITNRNHSINVRLEIDKENNIAMNINGHPVTKSTPKGISLNSETTKMSLWPVAIE